MGHFQTVRLGSAIGKSVVDCIVGIAEHWGDHVAIKEFASASVGVGIGLTMVWANQPGDVVGLSFGFGFNIKAISFIVSLGLSVKEQKRNDAVAYSIGMGVSLGVASPAGDGAPSLSVPVFLSMGIPLNMSDWHLSEDL